MQACSDIKVDTPVEGVQLIQFNRPDVKNALRTQLLAELAATLRASEADAAIRCVVITGGDVFAAGKAGTRHNARTNHRQQATFSGSFSQRSAAASL